MNFDGISEFVYVAETTSFTLAAKKLNISTAHVSRRITALEQKLNVKLLYRTTRKVSLTQEGQLFYQHCRNVLDGIEEAERVVTNLQQKPQGHIKLTAPVTYGEQKILPLVNDFIQQHSEVQVSAYLSNQKVDMIEQGFDLAIRLGKLADSTLMAKKLGSRTNYLCASPQYLEKYGMPHSLSELSDHSCLLGTLDYWRFKVAGKEKTIKVKGSLRYNNGTGLTDAALKGLGIVQLPDYYVKGFIAQGKLLPLLSQFQEADEGIWAVYPHNRQLSPKIRALVDYLSKHLAT
ncbi:LysR family transcriptional regulator [Cognaticolwellia mytili]|uniref:LysR family transcriptional regulator n=1 Tax=Cognaticolwellia mytili TaxID=1888913 RepID=UPI000A177CB7|nr:LysR family transcriptional regulator [Cognaticolwellia mytili]